MENTCILFLCREIFYGRRWRDNLLYQAPMAETNLTHVYVGDFVLVADQNSSRGSTLCAKVVRFFLKVYMRIKPMHILANHL